MSSFASPLSLFTVLYNSSPYSSSSLNAPILSLEGGGVFGNEIESRIQQDLKFL